MSGKYGPRSKKTYSIYNRPGTINPIDEQDPSIGDETLVRNKNEITDWPKDDHDDDGRMQNYPKRIDSISEPKKKIGVGMG
jgi:hypothetical protein